MDGRKNNRGTLGNNGGRKPKVDEILIIEAMDAVMVPNEAWQALADLVRGRDVVAVKTWLNYRYGMPKQLVDMNATVTEFPAPVIMTPYDGNTTEP